MDTMEGHDHELDGHLHLEEHCPMCEEIRRRTELVKRDIALDKLGNNYAAIADRTPRR